MLRPYLVTGYPPNHQYVHPNSPNQIDRSYKAAVTNSPTRDRTHAHADRPAGYADSVITESYRNGDPTWSGQQALSDWKLFDPVVQLCWPGHADERVKRR